MLNLDGSKKTQRKVLTVVAVVMVTSVFAFLIYRDFRQIGEIKTEIANTETAIQTARNKIAKIPAYEKDVIVLRENLNEYVKILPDGKEINDFVNKINNFADVAGVDVSKLDDVGARQRTKVRKGQAPDPFEKLVYKVNLRGSTPALIDFINAFENYERFVKVSSVDVRTGSKKSGAKISQHEANLTFETYVYNSGGGTSKPVAIEGYSDKLGNLTAEILASRDNIEIERYELKARTRRDPLADSRVLTGQEIEDDRVPVEEQERTLAGLVEEINRVHHQIELEGSDVSTLGVVERAELKRQINEKVTILQETIAAFAAREYFSGTVHPRFNSLVLEPVNRLLAERNIQGSSALTLDELTRTRNTMRDLFARGQYSDLITSYGQVESRFHFVTGTEEGVEMIQEVDQLKREASAIIEFSERSVLVTGVIFRPDNGSVAVVNGKVLSVGDTLDGDILVTSIDLDEVEFNFKSVSIRRTVD